MVAKRSYPMPKISAGGQEKQPHVQGAVAALAQEGLRSYSTFKVRRGGGEEILLVQGKRKPK